MENQPVTIPPMKKRLPPLEVSAFLLVVVVILYVAMLVFQHFWQERSRSGMYQAVFLTNGQVYFGKLQGSLGQDVILNDVYYLQSGASAQPASGQSTTANTNVNTNAAANANPYTLVKLGQELHGPTNRMYINRDQILFTEDLRSNSQVVQAIQSSAKK